MTELEKYEIINKAQSIKELEDAMDAIWPDGAVEGMTREFSREKMKAHIKPIVTTQGIREYPVNTLTRKYGLRQQALYLREYQLY